MGWKMLAPLRAPQNAFVFLIMPIIKNGINTSNIKFKILIIIIYLTNKIATISAIAKNANPKRMYC